LGKPLASSRPKLMLTERMKKGAKKKPRASELKTCEQISSAWHWGRGKIPRKNDPKSDEGFSGPRNENSSRRYGIRPQLRQSTQKRQQKMRRGGFSKGGSEAK